MVTSCCAYGYTKRYTKGENIGFYRFPKDPTLRMLWTRALKRKDWIPNLASRICGKHFQTDKPVLDKNHPDYVPNVFKFNPPKKSATLYEERMKRLIQRRRVQKETQQTSTAVNSESVSSQTNEDSELPQQQEDAFNEDISDAQASREKIRFLEHQVQSLKLENERLKTILQQTEKEMNFLRSEKSSLQETVTKLHPVNSILNNPKKLVLYTGLKSHALFHHIIMVLHDDFKDNNSFTIEAQFIIILMKLKLNLLTTDIAFRFNVSRKTVLQIYEKWFPILSSRLSYNFIRWPNSKAIRKYCPESLKNSEFRNAKCIIDCTEFLMQRPNPQLAQSQTFSNYKNNHTVKVLVAITPTGLICFLSKAWGGRVSDKEITLQSGFMDLIQEGDVILADRGFNLEEEFLAKGATLNVPSYTRGRKQLSKDEVLY